MANPISFNPGGLASIIAGATGPPIPLTPNPNTISMGLGITLLFAAMPFPPGGPYMIPGATTPAPPTSLPPAVPFITPAVPAAPVPVLAAAWKAALMATAASVMIVGIDIIPGTPPIPTPFTLPFIPAPD